MVDPESMWIFFLQGELGEQVVDLLFVIGGLRGGSSGYETTAARR